MPNGLIRARLAVAIRVNPLGLIGLSAILPWVLPAQGPGPFESPERFHQYRFPEVRVAACSLPLPPPKNSAIKSYKVGQMTVRIGNHVRVEGRDVLGAPWVLDADILQGACWKSPIRKGSGATATATTAWGV